MWETWVWSLGWEDPLEKGKATHSSILAWRIPWAVESMGSQRVQQDWATFTSLHIIQYRNNLHFTSVNSKGKLLKNKLNDTRKKQPDTPRKWDILQDNRLGASKVSVGASLVVQWLRIHLSMQGVQVRSLLWGDSTYRGPIKPVNHNYWAHSLEPKFHN